MKSYQLYTLIHSRLGTVKVKVLVKNKTVRLSRINLSLGYFSCPAILVIKFSRLTISDDMSSIIIGTLQSLFPGANRQYLIYARSDFFLLSPAVGSFMQISS